MSGYKRGTMDTTEQEKMFRGLVKGTAIAAVIVAVILIFLAIIGT